MVTLSIDQIIRKIKNKELVEAQPEDGSFIIKITKYVPFICTAVHDGSQLRSTLKKKVALDEYSRWYEEDPYTGKFISSLPITLIGCDSRYEYDLNRKPAECIYNIAWGKVVWHKKLDPTEVKISKTKHKNFYRVLHALVEKIEEEYNTCLLFDIHSYNYKRWDREVPLFNLGTAQLNQDKYRLYLNQWLDELSAIQLDQITNDTRENDVFQGMGYIAEYLSAKFQNTLVLPTEIKKVYCDELNGNHYPKIIRDLQRKLKKAILSLSLQFVKDLSSSSAKTSGSLLSQRADDQLLQVDRQLYHTIKNFELLARINPSNIESEHKKFRSSKFSENPHFKYSPIRIHPFRLKQQLGNIKTQKITDISIRNMYEEVINSYFDKIDLLASLNTERFLYNSLRYFGRPSKKDLDNAQYILHLPPLQSEPKSSPVIEPEQAMKVFEKALDGYGIDCKIEFSSKVVSKVMVLNSRKTIQFNPKARFTHKEVNALVEHEIGVHMTTTMNSNAHQLKVFNLGTPLNTKTQEGLAILAEYLSGNITLDRLRRLAHRVVVTDMMCNGDSFKKCFEYLAFEQNVSATDAFTLVTRVFRGGGFTKDFLYLTGFIEVLKLWENNTNLEPLLVGKTSLPYYGVITEMIERNMLSKPKYITHSFLEHQLQHSDPLYEYIVSGLKG